MQTTIPIHLLYNTTLLSVYHLTRHHNSEDLNFYQHCYENLKNTILLLLEVSSRSLDLNQASTHLLIHCLTKPHKLDDSYVSQSSLFLQNAIAQFFVDDKLSHSVKPLLPQNLIRQCSISLINTFSIKLSNIADSTTGVEGQSHTDVAECSSTQPFQDLPLLPPPKAYWPAVFSL